MDEAGSAIVIVGGGQAAGAAVLRLRQLAYRGRVVLVSDETAWPYERPGLSKDVLLGASPAPRPVLAEQQPGERFLTGTQALSIDRSRRVVRTTGGEWPYDRLLLATGARPRPLEVPGASLPGIHALRTAGDAQRIAESFGHCRAMRGALLIVGGSWIGLEVAAAARQQGLRVVLVEQGERLCQRTVPPSVSQRLMRLHAAHGVEIRLRTCVDAFSGEGRVRHARLSDGTSLALAAAVVGIGVLPNLDIARDAGLHTRQGIVVDACARTCDPFIHAAGDVAELHCRWQGRPVRYESWAHANHQAHLAADCMLRDLARPDLDAPAPLPAPWFWSDQFGRTLQLAGSPLLADEARLLHDDDEGFAEAYFAQDRLVGAAAIGHARAFRDLRRRIEPLVPDVAARPAAGSPVRPHH